MGLDVETAGLRTVSSDLTSAAQAFAEAGEGLAAVGSVTEPNLQAGVEAFTVAWGTALQVLAEDSSFMAGNVGDAADLYDTTDAGLAGAIDATLPAGRPPA